MKKICPNPQCPNPTSQIIKDGLFRRKEDSRFVQRFRCRSCGKKFSSATHSLEYRQKKRRINSPLRNLLASGISLRRAALILKVNPKTTERKLIYLGRKYRQKNKTFIKELRGEVHHLQIDDLITKENSKLKPLSVSIAVDGERRFLLGAEVSVIPSFGHLSVISRKKYGQRKDAHRDGLHALLSSIKLAISPEVRVKSDEHKAYPYLIKKFFPRAHHETFPGERSCVVGQGELKKLRFDPLFIVNHTCAMLRANINRLIRKTWCTTKKIERLKDHLDLFTYFYNQKILGLTPL